MNQTGAADGLGRFLTLADLAETLNISARQAYGLVRSGEIMALKIGSQWRIERIMLEMFIEDSYEVSRRAGLWNQADYGNIAELSFGDVELPDELHHKRTSNT
ncbi:helix-turn-helix domain-containing protein [Glaciihabitans sp. dw_435]|uniref:helix-turn-helix domain-containing protein n=1 Tax=Glaciihabitans sp. dw_435 TaxID=2720081 RepID=UPI001BD61FB7|nr:helix-turn-helix domain-containing protein [Glaciihabitans sp. dw_435]